jgi:hypothetical protein
MHRRSSNLCVCVIPVHELSKCVTSVPERCSGLTAGPNGSRPVIRDDVAYLGGTRLPPRAAPHRPPATLSSASASKAATATAAGRAPSPLLVRAKPPLQLQQGVLVTPCDEVERGPWSWRLRLWPYGARSRKLR